MALIRNYKYRIYPTPTQERKLDTLMSYGWRTYNDALHTRIQHYKATGETLSHYDLRDIMAASRNDHPDTFGKLSSSTVDALCKRVIDAYTGTFSRMRNGKDGKDAGFPSPAKRRDFRNLPFVYGKNIKIIQREKYDSQLRVSFGPRNFIYIEMHMHRPIPDDVKMKRVMLWQDSRRRWYAIVAVELPEEPTAPPLIPRNPVGIDIGMAYLLALSDGTTVENPRWYYQAQEKRRVIQQKLDRQRRANNPQNYNPDGTVKEGAIIWRKSNRQRRTEDQLRKLESRVANQRWYFWHTTTDWLTKTYDYIALEELTLEFMQKNKRLAMGVYDAAYATFWQMLAYKAQARGVTLVWVNPQYTSQRCANCGMIDKDNRKTQANFICVSCGHRDNADLNAAKNILEIGREGAVLSPTGQKSA